MASETAKATLESLATHNEDIADTADKLLAETIPARILYLDNLCKSDTFSWGKMVEVTDAARISLESDSNVNPVVQRYINQSKEDIQQLIDTCYVLRRWIKLLIPKCEDGDGLGVEIQGEIINECDVITGSIIQLYNGYSTYHMTRARFITKILKYPQVDQYKAGIIQYDEQIFMKMKITVCELHYYYVYLYDTITKNINKIRKPRNDNPEMILY